MRVARARRIVPEHVFFEEGLAIIIRALQQRKEEW